MIEIRDCAARAALEALEQDDEDYFSTLSPADVEFYRAIRSEAPGCISPTIDEEWE